MNADSPELQKQSETSESPETRRSGWRDFLADPRHDVFLKRAIQIGVVALIVILGWRLLTATFDFSTFRFADLLMLLLAFFTIWLSTSFYFQADRASSRFYDSTRAALIRIEERFGERLDYLKEHVQAAFERGGQIEEEQQKLVVRVMDATNLEDPEKEKIRSQLAELEKEKEELAREVQRLIRREPSASASAVSTLPAFGGYGRCTAPAATARGAGPST
jgi:hypothetical protein